MVTNGHSKSTKKVGHSKSVKTPRGFNKIPDFKIFPKKYVRCLALESDAINANFDLVYSDAEIENHVRNRDRQTAP